MIQAGGAVAFHSLKPGVLAAQQVMLNSPHVMPGTGAFFNWFQ
jgi:isoaspartyl peptidase/L-asparaginase-like protein (Ntn-hydrolase superfamily)